MATEAGARITFRVAVIDPCLRPHCRTAFARRTLFYRGTLFVSNGPSIEAPEHPVPQPPWIAPPKPPRTHLSRDVIVEAALRVVDREGIDGATMRRVADELNTGAASLYWHVRNREELLHLMLDTVAGEIRLPKPDPKNWQAQVKQLGREMRRALLRHKDIAKATMGRIPLGPNALRVSEWTLGLLRAAGIPDRTAALVIDLFALYVGAHATEQADGEIPM